MTVGVDEVVAVQHQLVDRHSGIQDGTRGHGLLVVNGDQTIVFLDVKFTAVVDAYSGMALEFKDLHLAIAALDKR